MRFDYQLDRHCSKTNNETERTMNEFDYQLDRHCSKTGGWSATVCDGLITS